MGSLGEIAGRFQTFDLPFARAVHRLALEEGTHAVDLADGRGIHPRQRGGVADHVARRDLRGMAVARLHHLDRLVRADQSVHHRLRHARMNIDAEPCHQLLPLLQRQRGTVGEMRRDAVFLALRQPDPEIEPERSRDLVGKKNVLPGVLPDTRRMTSPTR